MSRRALVAGAVMVTFAYWGNWINDGAPTKLGVFLAALLAVGVLVLTVGLVLSAIAWARGRFAAN